MKFGVMHKAALLPLCLSQTQGIKICGCKVEFLYYLNIDVPKGMKFTFQLKQKVYSCSTPDNLDSETKCFKKSEKVNYVAFVIIFNHTAWLCFILEYIHTKKATFGFEMKWNSNFECSLNVQYTTFILTRCEETTVCFVRL